MRQMKRLMPVAIVVFVLMACLSACDSAQAPLRSAGESYVAMAMQSSAGKAFGLSLFPKEVGTAKCMIRGGGPRPGISVPGVCTTSVLVRGNEATVQFKESWNAHRFYAGSVRHGRLSHVWEVTVSKEAAPGDDVIGVRDYGDFPPQLVR
jgi:hypothetical protein